MTPEVQRYIDEIPAAHRPLFDRVHRLILEVHPEAQPVIAYGMPTYRVGKRRLHVARWTHGISVYGWRAAGDGGFTQRHPHLVSGKGTVRLRPEDEDEVSDDELRAFMAAVLQG